MLMLKNTIPRSCLKEIFKRRMSTQPEVILEKIGDKAVITLNRPKALNALNLSMIRSIFPQMKVWRKETNLIIIKGTGDKAFCAGGDVRAVTEAGKKGEPLTQEFFREEYWLNNLIGHLEIPYVAILNGITMGGGVGLSVHGRYRVATEKIMFAMPETAIGLFPDVGGSYFLSRLKHHLGIYLALSGFRLKGRDTLHAGIATHTCDSSRVSELENELLNLPNANDSSVKDILDKYTEETEFDKDKEFVLAPHLQKIETIFGEKTVEEIFNRLSKDGSDWSLKQLDILKKMSPISMKISLRQLQEGAHMSLSDGLRMEYRLTQRVCADNDFYEGVRAVLIDKDNEPEWKPATLEGVTDSMVDKYFSLLPPEQELVFPDY